MSRAATDAEPSTGLAPMPPTRQLDALIAPPPARMLSLPALWAFWHAVAPNASMATASAMYRDRFTFPLPDAGNVSPGAADAVPTSAPGRRKRAEPRPDDRLVNVSGM